MANPAILNEITTNNDLTPKEYNFVSKVINNVTADNFLSTAQDDIVFVKFLIALAKISNAPADTLLSTEYRVTIISLYNNNKSSNPYMKPSIFKDWEEFMYSFDRFGFDQVVSIVLYQVGIPKSINATTTGTANAVNIALVNLMHAKVDAIHVLLSQGATYRDIGKQLGIKVSEVSTICGIVGFNMQKKPT